VFQRAGLYHQDSLVYSRFTYFDRRIAGFQGTTELDGIGLPKPQFQVSWSIAKIRRRH
jgi:hypothetical protein